MTLLLTQIVALHQFGDDVGEHRVKQGRIDGIELGADLAVAGDFRHPEQRLAVGPPARGLEMALVRQEGRLCMKNGANAAIAESVMA